MEIFWVYSTVIVCLVERFLPVTICCKGVRPSTMVRAFDHGLIIGSILHWAIFHSSQGSTTGITKAVVCAILSKRVAHVVGQWLCSLAI